MYSIVEKLTLLPVVNFVLQMGHIWLGLLATAGHLTPKDGGFHLYSVEEVVFEVPERWSGRVWGRQGCCFDEEIGKVHAKLVTVLAFCIANALVESLRPQLLK
ncbi:thaumatin-like protein [Quercus suber]|uniref:Thaumatin-like protein n=1 Tax=Quercus suber TaxID=58331 RepID=A0AAW0LYB8_QUESU